MKVIGPSRSTVHGTVPPSPKSDGATNGSDARMSVMSLPRPAPAEEAKGPGTAAEAAAPGTTAEVLSVVALSVAAETTA